MQNKLIDLCDIDGAILYNNDGTWGCYKPHYAEGYYHSYDAPITINMTTANVYYNITGFSMNDSYGPIIYNDKITNLNDAKGKRAN